MVKIFISYRRSDTRHITGRIYDRLVAHYGNDNIFRDIDKKTLGVDFRHKLRTAVADCDVLLVIMGDGWESVTDENGNYRLDNPDDFVRIEIESALLRPACLVVPILIDDAQMPKSNKLPDDLRALTFKDATYVRDSDFHADMNELIQYLDDYFNPPQPEPASMIESRVKIAPKTSVVLGMMMVVLVIMAVIILALLNGAKQSTTSTSDLTNTVEFAVIAIDDSTPDLLPFLVQTQTRESQLAHPTNTHIPTPNYNMTLDLLATQTSMTYPTNTLILTLPILPTNTSAPSPTLTIQPGYIGGAYITFNKEWIPVEQEIEGVMMVLVPKGCFVMGSSDEQIEYGINELGMQREWMDYEQPAHQQCFDELFWIDKYEVTNKQFNDFGGVAGRNGNWTEDNLPRESITWFEARDYCQNNRGGRLPTEAEWEYVAHGPNNLIYPWGNYFIVDNVVYSNNSNSIAPVGSRPSGVSWVGAMDMSGNVWEWVSSLYQPYPYSENNENIDYNVNTRVLRGGSWDSTNIGVRSANRYGVMPNNVDNVRGLRCVRSYNG